MKIFLSSHVLQLFPTDDDIPPKKRYKMSRRDSLTDIPSSKATNEKVDTCGTSIAKDNDENTQKANGSSLEAPKIELGRSLSSKWTTGAGPRIGCLREYPAELQIQALEQVNLSPKVKPGPYSSGTGNAPIPSPRPSPKFQLSPRVAYMGHTSPRIQTTKC